MVKKMYYTLYESLIGTLTLIGDGTFLLKIDVNTPPCRELIYKPDVFKDVIDWLDAYFAGKKVNPNTLPLKMIGTPFQVSVWNLLISIPYGEVTTYGVLANEIAKKRGMIKMSAQAIGNAIHENPLPIIIPCHRVIAKNNRLGGYALGLDNKLKLLAIEKIDITLLH